jgi:hypothetical protein
MVLQDPRVIELGVDLCPGEQQLIYCLPKEGIDWKVELNLKEWSDEFCPPLLPRVPMAWSSNITGDRTKGTQDRP